jgi:CBS-domain-containing membrane protein
MNSRASSDLLEDKDLEEVARNMSIMEIRHLPVVNRDKRLVGIISFGDSPAMRIRRTPGTPRQPSPAACCRVLTMGGLDD